ncbi:MAG: GNAT family N-acetyltransferase [Zoogloea sp.]|uniref:GNAT family N-acetyltransferase n=1 Tax=Zoogloea sp. TaxID=49181 RepID=UPI003F329465
MFRTDYVLSPRADLGFQNYRAEFARLPGDYAPPRGCLLLLREQGAVIGCGALRPVDGQTAELKRVYLRPSARGRGLGRQLVERLLEEARRAGYRRVCLDVLAEFQVATQLYLALGFTDGEAVSHNPIAGTRFMALNLEP